MPKALPSAETVIAAPALLLPKLAKLGLRTPLDLVLHLPLRYEDETQITLIEAARDGEAVLIARFDRQQLADNRAAWGIFLRIERLGIPRRRLVSRPETIALPEVLG